MTTFGWLKAANTNGIQDVPAPVNNSAPTIVVVGAGGTIFRMDSWDYFVADRGTAGFRRIAMSPDGTWLYGAGTNGTVWYSKARGAWTRFQAANQLSSLVEDLVVAYDNSLWVTLENGQM